jgi:hypothetical protein
MLNTFGLRSINTGTFNLGYHTNYTYPRQARNLVVTLLRAHNLCLNILGYIPGVATFSGCARMLTGASICLLTLSVGERDAQQGVIIGHWYDEALNTGVAQVARGATEAFMPYGRIVNLSLDVIGTISNLINEATNVSDKVSGCQCCPEFSNHGPYPDPNYPSVFGLLYLA